MTLCIAIIYLYFSSFILQTVAQRSCATVNDQEVTRVTDLENADFIFAGLFPIKERGCWLYQLERGVERMEAMIRAIELINEDTNILEGVKIGYDMRNTCGQETVGIEETVSLVQSEFGSGNLSGIPIGVIGPASSSVSVPVASFLRVFTIPQISYSSTSGLLSDTVRYDYFFRTVASDSFQARVMLDLIRRFGWRFVNAVFTASTYGTPGAEAFMSAVEESNDTCLDVESQVPEDEAMLAQLASRIALSFANVVVCFCTTTDANRILRAVNGYITMSGMNRTHIIWIASDAWATSEIAIDGMEDFVDGFFGVSPFSEELRNFTDYFTNISPYNITNDLWFCGYFRQKFNCEYNATSPNPCPNSIHSDPQGARNFAQNNIIPFIFDATYALAHALDSVLEANCKKPYNITQQKCVNKAGKATVRVGGELLRDALYNVNFTGITQDSVTFDATGDGLAKYIIYNYKSRQFKDVGYWDASRPNAEKLTLFDATDPVDNIRSYLGGIAPCEIGFRTDFQVGSRQCICAPCTGNTFSRNPFNDTCAVCPSGEWGNNPTNNNTGCVRVTTSINFINYNEWWCWVFLVFNLIGLVGWAIISIIYISNWNHKVVKASGREHCLLMLVGAGGGLSLAFFTLAKPILFTCIVWTLVYWLSLSLLIFPLLMKIIRIVRIFISKQNVHTRGFISWQWQILFSLIPVGIVLLIVIIAFATKPEVIEDFVLEISELESPIIHLRCKQAQTAFIICLYAIFILSVIILLFFAILTRTYPKNYSESIHIMYASFALIVVMFVNVIIFFVLSGEFQKYRQLVQNLCLIIIAYTILLAFFGPRLYYILFGAKGIKEDEMMSSAVRKDTTTLDLKKNLAKKHPNLVNPFDKYKEENPESASTETKENTEKTDGGTVGVDNVALEKDTDLIIEQ